MGKFWANEKFLVFSSIVLLLLFLGLIALFGSWIRILLGEPIPETVCPPPEITAEQRMALEEEIRSLNEALIDPTIREQDDCFLNPFNINLGLGLNHYQLGQHEESREAFTRALAEQEEAFVYALMAENEWQACRYQEARDHLEKAIELSPQNYDHHYRLIQLERDHLGADPERLDELYAAAVAATGSDRAYRGRAYFLEKRGEYQRAADVWRALWAIDPSQEEHYRSQVEWLESKI